MYSEVLDKQLGLRNWTLSPEGCEFLYHYGKQALVEDAEGWLSKDETGRMLLKDFGPGGAALVTVVLEATASDPYYWSAEMTDMLSEIRGSLPTTTLRQEMLPTRTGFVSFAKPIATPTGYNPITGFAWLWAGWGCMFIPFADHPYHPGLPTPRGAFPWEWGENHDQCRMVNDVNDDAALAFGRSIVATALLLLNQRIVMASRERADRGTRRRMQKAGMPQEEVQVVKLRAHVYEGVCDDTGTPDAPQWSCRWMVRGHWRQQFYPSDKSHRPKWILPYIKGPDDKPLQGATKLFAVVQ